MIDLQHKNLQTKASWHSHNPLTICFEGSNERFQCFLNTLVEDFNEPKFGYSNELWDEDQHD